MSGGIPAYWVGVASRDHVRAGVAGGFAQLGHGKRAGLDRLTPGDRLVYYSPRERMGAGAPVRAFTAVGEVLDAPVRRGEMGGDFHPFRRDVRFFSAREAPITPLLPVLACTRDRTHWGIVFRRGVFRITADDYGRIANAMQALQALD